MHPSPAASEVEPLPPLRLALVVQRFWPLVGGTQRMMANLAAGLAARGCCVTILTTQWRANWPAKITFRGVPVVRLPHPPQGTWSTLRYARLLGRWLHESRHQFDLIYVCGLKHDAYAAVRAVGDRVPVVLRPEAAGRHGDCLWQLDARCGRRIKRQCMRAAAFVAASRAIQRELKAAGYPRPRIHYLPDGVHVPPPADPATKAAARAALAAADPALEMSDAAPLAVYTGRLHPGRGLRRLVAAWQPIATRQGNAPLDIARRGTASRDNARLWLAGDGPDRAAIARQIETLNLTGRVVLGGVFDEPDELLAAADLFVLPAPIAGTSAALLEAMAAGLPIVGADTPGNRQIMADGQHGLLVKVSDIDALSAAMARLLDEPDLAVRLGAAARQRVAAEFSLAKMVDRHVTWFHRLIRQRADHATVVPAEQDRP